jgi:tripartite-type tricarboxylate transporter receptor subunit TctC
MEAAAKSAPDGYTILVSTDQVATLPHIMKINFDALHDLVPVIQLSRQPVVLAVHPSLGVDTVARFISLAKARPGMSYATSGIGSQQHIAAAWFAQLAGIKLEHVPYRGGGQAINDLIAGHVQVGSLGSSPLIPHYKAGTLRLLAQTTAARSPSLPDVPTYQGLGSRASSSISGSACSCRSARRRRSPSASIARPTRRLPTPQCARPSWSRRRSRWAAAPLSSRNW